MKLPINARTETEEQDLGIAVRCVFDSKIAGRCLAFSVSVPTVGLSELKGAGRHHACAAHGPPPHPPQHSRNPASKRGQETVVRSAANPELNGDSPGTSLPQDAGRGSCPAPEAGVTAGVTGECGL